MEVARSKYFKCNNEDVVGTDAAVLWWEALVAMVVAWREARKTSSKQKSAPHRRCTKTTVCTHEAVHCWWIFFENEPGEGHRGIDLLVSEVQGQDQREDAEVWPLQQVCEGNMIAWLCPSRLNQQTAGRLLESAD